MASSQQTPATQSRRSSVTVKSDPIETEKDLELDKTVIGDLEKFPKPAAPLSDQAVPGIAQASPLEDEQFPEGGRGWIVVLGAFIYASLVLGWPCVVRSPKHCTTNFLGQVVLGSLSVILPRAFVYGRRRYNAQFTGDATKSGKHDAPG